MFNKKGQTEDVFSDLIPAIVLIVIAIVAAGVLDVSHDSDVSQGVYSSDLVKLKIDFSTYLNSELNNQSINEWFMYNFSEIQNGQLCSEEFSDYTESFFNTRETFTIYILKDNQFVMLCPISAEEFSDIDLTGTSTDTYLAKMQDSFMVYLPTKDSLLTLEVGFVG